MLTTIDAAGIEALGIPLDAVVRRIIDLDHRAYSLENHGHIGSVAQWTPVFAAHPETWRALADKAGKIVAYWQIATLTASKFAQARAGLLRSSDLGCDDYLGLTTPGVRNLYVESICIDPGWRDLPTRWQLIDSFFEAAEALAARGVIFDKVAATAHSEEGVRACEAFGLAYLHDAAGHGACYAGDFANVIRNLGPALARRRPALARAYGVDARRPTPGSHHILAPGVA